MTFIRNELLSQKRSKFYKVNINNILLNLWLFIFTIDPILCVIYWQSVYILFIFIFISGLFYCISNNTILHIRIPFLLLCKFIIMIISIFVFYEQPGSIMNLLALFSLELMTVFFVCNMIDYKNYYKFFKKLATFCIINIILYFVISTILSKFMEVQNPVEDFFAGERIRLLAWKTGHSILIDLSFIMLIIALSNIAKFGLLKNIFIILLAFIFIILAKSAGAYLLFIVAIFAFIIESIFPSALLKSIIYFQLVILLAIYYMEPDLVTDILLFVRTELQGVDATQYANNDLTAGRANLNMLLIESIKNNPWFGVGHEDPLIQYGLGLYSALRLDEFLGAKSESGLRNAAKYGMIYFTFLTLFILQPVSAIFLTKDRSIRIFSVSLAFGLLTLSAVNPQFEIPHEPQHFIYLSLLIISLFLLKHNAPVTGQRPVSSARQELQIVYANRSHVFHEQNRQDSQQCNDVASHSDH